MLDGTDEMDLHGHSFSPFETSVLNRRVVQLKFLFFAEEVDQWLKRLAGFGDEASAVEDFDSEFRLVDDHVRIVRLVFLHGSQLDSLVIEGYGLVAIALRLCDLLVVDIDVFAHRGVGLQPHVDEVLQRGRPVRVCPDSAKQFLDYLLVHSPALL